MYRIYTRTEGQECTKQVSFGSRSLFVFTDFLFLFGLWPAGGVAVAFASLPPAAVASSSVSAVAAAVAVAAVVAAVRRRRRQIQSGSRARLGNKPRARKFDFLRRRVCTGRLGQLDRADRTRRVNAVAARPGERPAAAKQTVDLGSRLQNHYERHVDVDRRV